MPSNWKIPVTKLHHRLDINVGKQLYTWRLVDFVITCISIITDFHSKYKLDLFLLESK